jgi:hypothetical protein
MQIDGLSERDIRQGDWKVRAQKTSTIKQAMKECSMKTRPTVNQSEIIPQRTMLCLALEVEGTAPAIQNCFNQKVIEEMLRKHMGLPVQREKKVPADCIERAITRNTEEVICFPPTAFKKAMLTAAAQVKGLKKTMLRASLFVEGGSVPITYSRMVARMDIVRTSGQGRTPDVRFRPAFEDWKARLILLFADMIPAQTVVDLLNRAGNVGIGEWRPEKDGNFGTFTVVRAITDPKEISQVRKMCRPAIKPLIIPEWAMNAELSVELLSKIAGSGQLDGEDNNDD